jgi:hypothetical protein
MSAEAGAAEYVATARALVVQLAQADPARTRFGARRHQYALPPPLGEAHVAAIERAAGVRLPDDYRLHVAEVAAAGAGPHHGLLPLDHPRQRALLAGPSPLPAVAPPHALDGSPWRGCVALGHVGCGAWTLLVVDGPARGTVWLDARGVGVGVRPVADSFAAYYLDWLLRAARGQTAAPLLPAGACALPSALGGYLRAVAAAAGVDELHGAALRAALGDLPAGGVALAATGDDPIAARGQPLDPCLTCALLVEQLGPDGLRPDVIADGVAPLGDLR